MDQQQAIAQARAYVDALDPQATKRAEERSMHFFRVGKMLGVLGDDWPATYSGVTGDRAALLAYYAACVLGVMIAIEIQQPPDSAPLGQYPA